MFEKIADNWPVEVRERLASLNENEEKLEGRLELINQRYPREQRNNILDVAIKASTRKKRIFWLRKDAQRIIEATDGLTACKKGCSHCCSIGVMMLESEAKEIGIEIGRTPDSPAEGKFISTTVGSDPADFAEQAEKLALEFIGVPCTFLGSDGDCSIYESRPLACRLQLNMDQDALLCKLVPGYSVPVPYLNVEQSKMASILANGTNVKMADLRHFFPART